MASVNLVGQMEEQPSTTKPRIDNAEEQEEIRISNGSGLPKSTEQKDGEPENSTMDLPLPSFRLPLPLELNCEIFKCLKLPVQKKFICGLGRDIYGIFGQKLLKKTKRVRNPRGNRCNGATRTTTVVTGRSPRDTLILTHHYTVAADGLNVSGTKGCSNVFAVQPFPISGPHCRVDDFPGTICYYYEVKFQGQGCLCNLGLSRASAITDKSDAFIGEYSNSYAIPIAGNSCYRSRLAGASHYFELPEGAVQPIWKRKGNVFGCGLVLDPDNKLEIFFTLNGKLLDQKIPISPMVDRLFPAVTMMWAESSFEANFGDDPAKPFVYDISNCPGLGLASV